MLCNPQMYVIIMEIYMFKVHVHCFFFTILHVYTVYIYVMTGNRRKAHLHKIDCPNIIFQIFTIESLYIQEYN